MGGTRPDKTKRFTRAGFQIPQPRSASAARARFNETLRFWNPAGREALLSESLRRRMVEQSSSRAPGGALRWPKTFSGEALRYLQQFQKERFSRPRPTVKRFLLMNEQPRPGLRKRFGLGRYRNRSASVQAFSRREALRPQRLFPVKRFNLNGWIPRPGGHCFSLGRSASGRENTKAKALGLPMGQRERSAFGSWRPGQRFPLGRRNEALPYGKP